MERYKLRIFQAAQRDMREIVAYLNTLSPQAALRYYDLLTEKIASLEHVPQRCPLLRNAQLRLQGYRALPVENYLVFFIVREDTVQIRRVLYAKRQYEWML